MNANGILGQHWIRVSAHMIVDTLLFCVAFLIGTVLRLADESTTEELMTKFWAYLPGIILGGVCFSCVIYMTGLYSSQSYRQGVFRRVCLVGGALAGTVGLMSAVFYMNKSMEIGRGVIAWSVPVAYFSLLIHHMMLLRSLRNYRERVAFIMTCTFDELEARFFQSLGTENLELVGLVHYNNYQPIGEMRVLGPVSSLKEVVLRENIQRILCTNKSISDPAMCKVFCELRYSGVSVMPLVSLFEEVHQLVPLELITSEWLLTASSLPHVLYIKKVKRAFDILCSLFGLMILGLPMLAGMLLVRLTSRGPIFYRQVRCGRFGLPFQVIKLRTMRLDAEKDGAKWSSAKDPRVTPVGAFLRRYRIDEIPQLVNVLRGEMSFVGPRPERPEFVEELSQQIQFFHERLMVQPGLTGWAQVNYPYGATVEDSKWKLEYDLYYMKHMSIFLDLFILLDTVRIVLRGGLGEKAKERLPRYEAIWFFRVFNEKGR